MFEKFTERARSVLVLAQGAASETHSTFIGTEHLLIGLVAEGTGVGAVALDSLGVTTEAVRAKVAELSEPRPAPTKAKQPPFTPQAKKVLELSLREALELGHHYIGTEHLLLGLTRENDGLAARVLADLGVPLHSIRVRVIQLLSGYGSRRPAPEPMSPAAKVVLERARSAASGRTMTTRDLIDALLTDDVSALGPALASLGVTKQDLGGALVNFPEESSATVEIKVDGEAPVVIADPQIAAALAAMDRDELRRRLLG
jgi:ATP-dependent Clp protease ATP-binding subunit ClpA